MVRSNLSKLILTVCFVIGIGLIAFLALPFIIDTLILPPLLVKTGFSSPEASISRLTPYELSGSVDLKSQGKPSLSIPRLKLRYAPGTLLHRKIDSLELAHAVFHLYRQQDRWLFPGDIGQQPAQTGKRPSDRLLLLPLGVDKLILKNCSIIIHDGSGRELHIGISAHIEPEFADVEKNHLLQTIKGSLRLFDDIAADVSFLISAHDDTIKAHVELENGTMFLPNYAVPAVLKPFTFNSLSARLNAEIDAGSFALKHYVLNGGLSGMRFTSGQTDIGGAGENGGVTFALSGTDREHAYRISSLLLNSPVQAGINVDGRASLKDHHLHVAGDIDSFLLSAHLDETIKIPLSLKYSGSWSEESGYRLAVNGDCRSSQPLELLGDALVIELGNVQFSGTVDGDEQLNRARFTLQSAPLTVTYDNREIKTSPIDLAATVARIDDMYAARLSGSIASVDVPRNHIRLEDLRFSLPYATAPSLADEFSDGSIGIGSLVFNGEKVVSLFASITLQDMTYSGSGSIDSLFNSELHAAFDGEVSLPAKAGHLTWSLDPVNMTRETIPKQVPLPIDLDFSGTIAASGIVNIDNLHTSAAVKTSISDGSLELSDSSLSIKEINCTVEFPELPRFTSSPSQSCSTGAIDLASLHFDDAQLSFRIEDSRSIFIEKSRLSWCDGTLDLGSVRLSPNAPEIDTTLYCSRIRLGSLLEQFGFKGTEGEGSLNGRLPVRLSKNSIEFDDGFLFSTPGTGGIVRFTDTELLRQGMGSVSETGHISYSLAALENFAYNWTKLTFDSTDDDLLLTLELDGKPTTPLPFKFDRKGMIVESSNSKGLQYPIRLDVNFRLPLADLFQIGQSINSLMGNSQ